mgnify:CR=1 FL=1
MSYSIYQFEAVFIQDYLLADGKVKTMVGASELLEEITNGLLDKAIAQLGLETIYPDDIEKQKDLLLKGNEVIFPRRAGSVFQMVAQNQEKAEDFSKLWPMMVANFAPGLRFSAVLKSGDNYSAIAKDVRDALTNQKNQPQSLLPQSTPLTVRYQRTGRAQVNAPGSNNKLGQDWTMPAKAAGENSFDFLSRKHLFNEPFMHQLSESNYVFPKQFEHTNSDGFWREAFPFQSTDPGNHTVAIIHSDGNGLGGYLHDIFQNIQSNLQSAEQIRAYQAFSVGLDEATQQAAQQATAWLAKQYETNESDDNPYKQKVKGSKLPLPMRPIILGGDDLTCIVRADYAIGFVQEFTRHFEIKTRRFISDLKTDFKNIFETLPEFLSCTTGMVFLRSNQPFNLGYALAEELCSEAKKVGRQSNSSASLLNFMRTTNTLFDNYDIQVEQELKTQNNEFLSAMPYAFKEAGDNERPTISQLFTLSQYFDENDKNKLKPSAIRRYATYLYSDPNYAQTFWSRWEKQCLENPNLKTVWNDFDQDLQKIKKQSAGLPIADLITLFALNIKEFADE